MAEIDTKELAWIDFSACVRCEHLGSIGTHIAIEYCKKDFPDDPWKNEGEPIKMIGNRVFVLGCQRFEWNGIPLHKSVLEEIKTDPKLSDSILKDFTAEGFIVDPTMEDYATVIDYSKA